jgi:plasmid segregation protein ParM
MSNTDKGAVVKKIICGCDDGHDSIKAVVCVLDVVDGAVAKMEIQMLTIPSKVLHGARATSLSSGGADGGIYVVDGKTFTVSDGMSGEVIDTRSIDYPTSAVNRVLVNDALLRMGYGGCEVSLVSGLPVSDYYDGVQPNIDLIERKKANLLTEVAPVQSFPAGKALPKIISHSVCSEGVSAFYHMAINDDGSDNEEFMALLEEGPVGVIDIGGKTIDMAVVALNRGMAQVDIQRSGSINYAMLKVQDAIQTQLMKDYSLRQPVAPRAMKRILSEKRLVLSGQSIDVSQSVEAAVNQCWPEIEGAVLSRWGKAEDMMRVVVAGGGSYLLFDRFKGIFSHAVRPENPEYANGCGMAKVGVLNFQQSLEDASSAVSA